MWHRRCREGEETGYPLVRFAGFTQERDPSPAFVFWRQRRVLTTLSRLHQHGEGRRLLVEPLALLPIPSDCGRQLAGGHLPDCALHRLAVGVHPDSEQLVKLGSEGPSA